MGAGSTAVAAVRTGRHYVGYDLDPAYVRAARERVAATRPVAPFDGASAVDAAIELCHEAGFADVKKPKGARDLVAMDASGRRWQVLVGGGRTVSRPGLRRVEEAWRVIALASAATDPTVVVTPALAPSHSPAAAALKAVTGADRPIAAVIELGTPSAAATLRDLIERRA
jgi:hypothetical protein